MELHQKETSTVKNRVKTLDAEYLTQKASEGLLKLSIELGIEVIRQLMEEEVTENDGEKGKHQHEHKACFFGRLFLTQILWSQQIRSVRKLKKARPV